MSWGAGRGRSQEQGCHMGWVFSNQNRRHIFICPSGVKINLFLFERVNMIRLLWNTWATPSYTREPVDMCWGSTDLGAIREGRYWSSAGSSNGSECERNQIPYPPCTEQTQQVHQKRCRAAPAGMLLETQLAGVSTTLPRATGLAAWVLFPFRFH